MHRSIFSILICLVFVSVLSAPETAWGDHRGKNIAYGKTVAGSGLFFVGGFGATQIVDYGSITDGVVFQPGQDWTAGAVWWDEGVDSIANSLTVYLGKTYKVHKLVVQVDNNDDYRISWYDKLNGTTSVVVSPTFIPFPGGLAKPVTVKIKAVTDSFVIEHLPGGRGDGYYSVSEFKAYGKKR